MKLSPIIAAAILFALSITNANAEAYHGALQFRSTVTRAEVQSQALAASRAPDSFREGACAGVAPALSGLADKVDVRSQALAATRAGNPYAELIGAGVISFAPGTVDRQAVRAEARTTAARSATEAFQ